MCQLLERAGWQLLRVWGSHHVYGMPGEQARLSVPVHGNDKLKTGLQSHLLKLAGIQDDAPWSARYAH